MKFNPGKKRKAQAALEFLMTYGWAILVVLAAIAALVYFGVFSPERFLPESCVLTSGLACVDFKITSTNVSLFIQNGLGETVNIQGINLTNTACTTLAGANLTDGSTNTFVINCSNSGSSKFTSNIEVTYKTASGQFSHLRRGKIAGRVET
ncbi:MAG TPA: hypothetical protein VI894_02835 [Candidatus Nanoarchaeia archaeon]|nr:hypothetical protein [Candidatus Nanoarchaeia archaeon]